MRKGIEVRLGPGDRERLEAVIGSGNSPQKHVWRARIVLLSAVGVGTMAIQRQTGKRQADDLALAGALHGRGRRRPAARGHPAGRQTAAGGADHRAGGGDDAGRTAGRDNALDRPGDGEGGRGQPSQRAAHLGGTWPQAAPGQDFQAVERSQVCRQSAGRRRPLCRPARARAGAVGRREVANPGATAPSRGCR